MSWQLLTALEDSLAELLDRRIRPWVLWDTEPRITAAENQQEFSSQPVISQ
jgi:hypothetical protein